MNAESHTPVAREDVVLNESPRDGKLTLRKNKLKNLTIRSGLKGGRTCQPTRTPDPTWTMG